MTTAHEPALVDTNVLVYAVFEECEHLAAVAMRAQSLVAGLRVENWLH